MVATTTSLNSVLPRSKPEALSVPSDKTTTITGQLRELILVSTSIALLLAYSAFIGYDLMTYRQSMATQLSVLADVTARNTLGALAFQDQEAAGLALATLNADPRIEYAALLSVDGKVFAEHILPGADTEEIFGRLFREGVHLNTGYMTLIRPVYLQEERIGTLALYASLAEQMIRVRRFAGIGALILLFSFAASFAISRRYRAAIIDPLRDLTRLVGQLSEETGFSVRARTADIRIKEIQMLASGFNEMLGTLQTRDAQLRINEERLSLALLGSGQSMWDWELSADEIFFDQQASAVLGFRPAKDAEAFGFEIGQVHPDDYSRLRDAHSSCLLGQTGMFEIECRVPAGDDEWRWVEIGGKVVARDDSGAPIRVAGTLQDIDERKKQQAERSRLEAQLLHSQKVESLGQLTGGIAHDFNNLLSIITGNLQLLERSADDKQTELLQPALGAALRGGELTARLLAYARRQPLTPKTVDLNELLTETADLLGRTIGELIDVKTILYEPLWLTTIDPGQLENAVMNLVINARDAMPDGGALTIESSNVTLNSRDVVRQPMAIPGDYVLLAISDTGTGIAPEVLEKAFDPFFTTKDVGKGTGLGLSMVWGFVDQSGGHVDIDSEPGHGTCVRIYLPRSYGALSKDDGDSGGEIVAGGDEIILVVDDDDIVRDVAAELLRDYGYDVLEAHDGSAALEILNQRDDIDLLFTDVMMPGIRGPVLAEMARKLRPNLSVLFTSGYTESAVMYRGALVDSTLLLTKPYDREELARRIRYALSEGAEK